MRANPDSTPAITDGPFPESKEFLAGYWMIDVDGPQRACEIAARLSAIPGPGNALACESPHRSASDHETQRRCLMVQISCDSSVENLLRELGPRGAGAP